MSITPVEWFEAWAKNIPMPGTRKMFEIAAAALREKAERENPKPLTLEELQQMDGEPVWVCEAASWATVRTVDDDDGNITPFVCGTLGREKFWAGFTWKVSECRLHCYRHKPKGVA